MCQVEWFHQVIPYLSESATRTLSALITAHPHCLERGVSTAGTPVIRPRISLLELEAASKLPRRSIQRGLGLLVEMGLVKIYRSRDPHGKTKYEIPLMLPDWLPKKRHRRGDKLSPGGRQQLYEGRQIVTPVGGGGDIGEEIIVPISLSTPTTEEVVKGKPKRGAKSIPLELETQLQDIGELHPRDLVGKYSPERVEAALRHLKSRPRDSIQNPPGWLRYQLESGANFSVHLPQHESWGGEVQRKMCPHLHGQPCRVPGVQPDKCKLEDCPNEMLKRVVRSGAGQSG